MTHNNLNGAQSLVQTLVNCDVNVCFANPGTSEMHFVAALDSTPRMRAVLCLFEGVATGAADGYGRIAQKPASTLLHLGPGLANGLANLHNARRANTPVVNVVGDHATYHLQYDALLTSDIVGFSRPVSKWIHESKSSLTVATDAARAVQASMSGARGVATLILPADTAWNRAERVAQMPSIGCEKVDAETIKQVAGLLKNGKKTAILIRGDGLFGAGLEAAGRIKAATGARILSDTFAPRLDMGAGLTTVERIPYFAEAIVAFFGDTEQLILVGAKPPVSFFAYPGKSSWCLPDTCVIHHLAQVDEDVTDALLNLADDLGPVDAASSKTTFYIPELSSNELNPKTIGEVIATYTPENAIFSNEAATASESLLVAIAKGRPCTHLPLSGGAIGQGLPVAVGAAIAAPDRKVVCPHGDGGAAYTMQALWTMARENLDITVVIYANRSYAILNIELQRVGAIGAGPKALSMLDLHNPEMNWVKMAEAMGVEASRATTLDQFVDMYKSAMSQKGPRLIEAMI